MDDQAVVEVQDTGLGFSAAQGARLFQAFSQVHGTAAERRGGAGLGLYIARGLVEAHGGAAWATSPGPGQGATFAFRLPLVRRPAGGA
jgi:signal transduction histidine kinase